jgi:hypothetical protein
MLNTYKLLDFKIPIIRANFMFPDALPFFINGKLAYNNQVDIDPEIILTDNFINLLTNELKFKLRRVIVFSYNNRRLAAIVPHIDGYMQFNPAINLVVTRGQHIAEWYKVKDGAIGGRHRKTNFGEDVVIFPLEELEVIDSTFDTGPYLFNTSIPHKGEMVTGVEEWTISIRFDMDPSETWETFCNRFNSYIIKKRSS